MSARGFAVENLNVRPDGDTVIDFEITANRPDCMSVIGIARELATAYSVPLRMLEETSAPVNAKIDKPGLQIIKLKKTEREDVDVIVEDSTLCPRYAGAVVDVSVAPSPSWMQTRLAASGIRPISNIVDVTNYVLLELGHPLHAFDLAKLTNAKLHIRRSQSGEMLHTLDDQRRELSSEMLVIADTDKPVAIAGVIGGADSQVTKNTKSIVLESAYFDPRSVRRTSKLLGIKTEASMRFERGADPELPVIAMGRACALLEAIGGGTTRGTVIDRYPKHFKSIILQLRRDRINGLLGKEISDADIQRILGNLGFTLESNSNGWNVTVPTRRVDVQREVDLIEEVARHYGFDRLPATFPSLQAPTPPSDPRINQARKLRKTMTASGFFEAVTFGFIAKPDAKLFSSEDELVPIANPLSESFAVLRPSLIPGLIATVAYNRRRQRRDVRVFEVGSKFSRTSGERRSIGCSWTGSAIPEHWSNRSRDVDFFDIKTVSEKICEVLGTQAQIKPAHKEWLASERSVTLLQNGAELGVFGQLLPSIAESFGLPDDPVYVAEIELDTTEVHITDRNIRIESLPRFPSTTRDVSVLVDETLAAEQLRNTIVNAAPSTLTEIREFDRYQGTGVAKGKASLSVRLTFQSKERTLTDAEIQEAMEDILVALVQKHNAVQR